MNSKEFSLIIEGIVKEVIKKVHEADIEVMANYIYGLPGDTKETMKKTYDLSLELCTAGWNTYAAMALPGSQLYKNAVENNIKLPESIEKYRITNPDGLHINWVHVKNGNLFSKEL